MNELTAAVSLAQLAKLEGIAARRNALGRRLTAAIRGIAGIRPMEERAGTRSSYWFYMFRVDAAELGAGRDQFAEALKAEGVVCEPGYVSDVMYRYRLFRERSAYPHSEYPFRDPVSGRVTEYPDGLCPEAERIVKDCVWMPLNQWFTDRDIDEVGAGIRKVAGHFRARRDEVSRR
jgi:perosamine synthetase